VQFGGLSIAFDDRVLRPRAWTLAQSQWAAELVADGPPGPVLELFTGAGHIGLAAVVSGSRDAVLVDLNPAACAFARLNAAAAGMQSRVEVREGRIDEVVAPQERFAMVIADPPWVPSSGTGQFPDDPEIAIDGGEDGLDLARTACAVIDRHLAAGGSAILQLGSVEQADLIEHHLEHELDSDVRLAETRSFDRGVLVRLAR
jgi:methylase of polypeptide subunit release factors